MYRRNVLGGAAVGSMAILAGCIDGRSGWKYCLYVEDAGRDDAVAGLSTRLSSLEGEAHRVADVAIRTGGARTYADRRRELPLDEPADVRTEDGFYRLASERTGDADVERWVLRADPVEDPETEPVAFGDLDGAQARYVEKAVFLADRRRELVGDDEVDRDDQSFGAVLPPDPEELSLAPDPDPAVVVHDRYGTFRLRATEETITQREYTYRSTLVAADVDGFLDARVVDFDDPPLSDEGHDVFETAIAGDHYTEGWSDGETDDEAFSEPFLEIVGRIRDGAEDQDLTELEDVVHYARYGGEYYRVELVLRDRRYDPGDC